MDGDLEGDTAVLLEANLVSPTPGSVWDDGVATTVTRDDVQVVSFSIALDKPVMKNKMSKLWLIFQRPDAAVLVDVVDSTGDGRSLG